MIGWDEPALLGKSSRAAGRSEIGQVRADNEDALLCDPSRGLYIVADGMGGHAAGEQASATAISTLNAELTAERLQAALAEGEEAVCELLTQALEAVNEAILQVSDAHPEWKGLGTTAVIVLIDGDTLYVINVGDSRAYLLRTKLTEILSRDHSVAATLVENGIITADELREHPMRNQLTMVLGAHQEINPAFTTRALQSGDRIVLCSDGLWDMLEDVDIAGITRFSSNPKEAAMSLIAAADDAGGLDNITAVVIFH